MPTAPADLPHALDDVDRLLARLGRRVAVFLDYDGTLAPIVEDPDAAVMSSPTRRAVARLAAMVPLAMVSGRDAEDVRAKVDLPGVVYAGSHGLDLRDDHGRDIGDDEAHAYLDAVDRAEARLRTELDGLDGVQVERKRYAVAVHYRRAPGAADQVRAACEQVAADDDLLRTSGGKEIVEVRPALERDKGTAVADLLAQTGDDRTALYVGDDLTDEDAFRALRASGRGVGVLVRDDERAADSDATFALDGTQEVPALLVRIAEHLGGLVPEDSGRDDSERDGSERDGSGRDGGPWVLAYDHPDPAGEATREALSTVGNGVVCTRGAASEAVADGVHYKGTYHAGLYDRAVTHLPGHDVENEDLVNCPDWTLLRLHVDGRAIALDAPGVRDYRQALDLRTGVLTRSATVDVGDARRLRVTQTRWLSMADPRYAVQTLEVTALDRAVDLEVEAALDGTVVNRGVDRYADLEGRHLEPVSASVDGELSALAVSTRQSRIEIAVATRTRLTVDDRLLDEGRAEVRDGWAGRRSRVRLGPGQRLDVRRLAAIVTQRDVAVADPLTTARDAITDSPGLARLRADHERAWASRWPHYDMQVDGLDDRDRLALNLHAYHVMTTLSEHTVPLDVGIPARGWHGEAYRGHIFWDELYVVPLLALTEPQLARAGLRYRYDRLRAARALAEDEGYAGALFGWQTGSDGREESQRIHLNPVSGEWGPDASHLQRHVNASLAWEVWHLWRAADDDAWLAEVGAELLVELARFWSTIAQQGEDGRFHIRGVMGPDEFHEAHPGADRPGLDDNAYTNVMAAWVLERADDVLDALPAARRAEVATRIGLADGERTRWREISRALHVPVRDGIIEQFSGYLDLPDLDWAAYRARYGDIRRLDRILGAEGDTPDRYQVAKQADTLLLWYVLDPEEVADVLGSLGVGEHVDVDRTVDHHLARTAHGSTLSPLVHAWVLAVLGREGSWPLFREALDSDLSDVQGGTTGEGIHLGVMAGTLDLLRRCYAGVSVDGGVVRLRPRLPPQLQRIALQIRLPDGRALRVEVQHDVVHLSAPPEGAPLAIEVAGTGRVEVAAGARRSVDLR